MKLRDIAALLLFALIGTVGCGQATGPTDEPGASGGGLELVVPGKDDNYYSNVAQEYELSGTIGVTLTEGEQADELVRDTAIQKRLTAVGLYLTAYLTAKFEGIDINDNGEIDADEVFFRNVDYGGFQAMVRNYSLETEDISQLEDGSVSVNFTIDVGGPANFLDQLIEQGADTSDGIAFDLQMPAGATSDPESVSRGQIRNFDPAQHTGELESVRLQVDVLPAISDAYPHYVDFMADGVYDITMFFGHDYNTPRSDLQEAEESFDHLVQRGFTPPVETYADLGADSGPLTKTINFAGRDVLVEVRLFHGDMFTTDRALHKQTAIDELINRDVFFYNGHAGPYYGLYLDAAHAADVSYLEIQELPLSEKQQLFVAQGCQTYSQYADMLYANPNKSEDNLDAITTVNYSYGIGTLPLLDNLTSFDGNDKFQPSTFYEIVSDLNAEYWNSLKEVFYGVMGLDGNPQLHPEVDITTVGLDCNGHEDCGTTQDANLCLNFSDGNSYCVARTLGDRCPDGTNYAHVGTDTTIIGGVCYR